MDSQTAGTRDSETEAMDLVMAAIAPLDIFARSRVLKWAMARFVLPTGWSMQQGRNHSLPAIDGSGRGSVDPAMNSTR